ncbi:MAG: PAS domain S-box protein, partial [Pseudolabrys sp.]|nr:PAS domain S-box protein [Pseudolabrys sp.]
MKSSSFTDSLTPEGRSRLLIEAITDYAVYMLDPNGIVLTWNPGAERFEGYSADEIVGRNFSCLYTKDDLAADVPRRALEAAAANGTFETEGWRVRRDGSRFWAYVIFNPIHAPDGKLIGF